MTASPNDVRFANDAWLRHIWGQTSHHCGLRWSNIIFAEQMHHIAAGDASFYLLLNPTDSNAHLGRDVVSNAMRLNNSFAKMQIRASKLARKHFYSLLHPEARPVGAMPSGSPKFCCQPIKKAGDIPAFLFFLPIILQVCLLQLSLVQRCLAFLTRLT